MAITEKECLDMVRLRIVGQVPKLETQVCKHTPRIRGFGSREVVLVLPSIPCVLAFIFG